MTTLPAFSIFNTQDPPHRHYVIASHDQTNEYGVVTSYKVMTNIKRTAWWIGASRHSGWRASPGMRTSSLAKASQWIADVTAGDVRIGEINVTTL